jgi:ABC-type sulfate/molybdate transport systems ATPase subunit
MLELRDVVVRPGGATILAVERFAVTDGTTAVLGPNGAGKSTLLRVAGALLRPDSGSVLFDGRPATRARVRGAVTAVLQRPLLRRATVQANAETALRFHGIDRAQARATAAEWLERLGVGALAARQADTLSGGEAQRVSLARALAVRPRLLLLDEPFANLDATTRGELLADLRATLGATRTAALFVTHDRHEAVALADRIAVLHGGRLRQEGPAPVVVDAPADPDAARALGYENVVPASLVHGDRAGWVAFRAEHCSVAADGSGVAGELAGVVPLGPVARVVADVAGRRVVAWAPMPLPPWLQAARPGAHVVLRVGAEHVRPLAG